MKTRPRLSIEIFYRKYVANGKIMTTVRKEQINRNKSLESNKNLPHIQQMLVMVVYYMKKKRKKRKKIRK